MAVTLLAMALLCQPAEAVTTVTVEGKTVVIHVPIDVRGIRGVKVKDTRTGESVDAATYIKREVERIWNEAFQGFSYDCWKFRLDLKLFAIGYDTVAERHIAGHHLVRIDSKVSNSYWNVTGTDHQCTNCDFTFAYTRDMTGVFNTPEPEVLAHEVGHAMGLGDDYFRGGGYKPEAGGIGERAGGVYFVDKDGDVVQPGSFMTRGVGRPEAVHMWRIVATMKEAGVLPPCPCASGVRWNGTMRAVHQPGGELRVSTEVKAQLCEKRLYPLPTPPAKGMIDIITLEDAGSILTRRYWTDTNWTSEPCIYSGQGGSSAMSPAGEISRTLEDIGPRGELRWSTPTYWVSLAPTKSPDYTEVCAYDKTTPTRIHEGGSGSWSVNSGPERQVALEGGRMVGSYRDGPVDFVSWSICREGVACPPAAPFPENASGDGRRTGVPPAGRTSSAPAAPAAPSAPPGAATK